MWQIEKTVSKGDYIYAVVPDHPKATKHGYVLAHRVLMENKLGRMLQKDEEVHHKNGDTRDNRIRNLELIGALEHRKLHAKKRYPNGRATATLVCPFCGETFVRFANQLPEAKGKPQRNVFCSRRCNGKFNAGVSPQPSKLTKG